MTNKEREYYENIIKIIREIKKEISEMLVRHE